MKPTPESRRRQFLEEMGALMGVKNPRLALVYKFLQNQFYLGGPSNRHKCHSVMSKIYGRERYIEMLSKRLGERRYIILLSELAGVSRGYAGAFLGRYHPEYIGEGRRRLKL